MDDSFFGFDTSAPLDDGGGGRIAEPSEEEYDALNDETFGSAVNGDWEEAHESLVRLTDDFSFNTNCAEGGPLYNGPVEYHDKQFLSSATSSGCSPITSAPQTAKVQRKDRNADSDLELNLSGMKLDDMELTFDDSESLADEVGGSIRLDPGVWASQPLKYSNTTLTLEGLKAREAIFGSAKQPHASCAINNPDDYLREQYLTHFYQHVKSDEKSKAVTDLTQISQPTNTPKICTLEDVERNLMIQQAFQKQREQLKEPQKGINQQQILIDSLKKGTRAQTAPQQQSQQLQQQFFQKHQQTQQKEFGPTQILQRPANNFANNAPQHSLGGVLQQQQPPSITGNRLPPGLPIYPPGLAPHLQNPLHAQLPPHPLLNQHGLPQNFPHPRPLSNPHLPVALNNFAMHPNFNAMRAAAAAARLHPTALMQQPSQQQRMPPHLPNPVPLLNHQHPNSMYNMFNMRLVQEIQQNHPMLQNATRQSLSSTPYSNNNIAHHPQRNNNLKQNHHRRESNSANGNLPTEEFDEYANLMSTRDKHWLIGIQLSQLNTDTPYIDDFYYTVYRQRKAIVSGNFGHSQAHKDNQLNHPLTQPKGHAQLILVQLGNKNGTRNGQQRERHSSEAGGVPISGNGQDQKTPYVFTPLRFENSLGKLQYGSVTAPRKIIDAEIMTNDVISENPGINIKGNSIGQAQSKTHAITAALSSSSSGGLVGEATSAQRKSRHILLHIETLYRIVLKLEDLDNPNAIATILMKKKKETERIAALEQLENANKTAEERSDDASNSIINPILKHKFPYEIETKEALLSQLFAGLTHEKVVAMMNVRKGKVLIRRVMPYIETYDVRWQVWAAVFSSLQNIVKKDRDDSEGALYSLYSEFKKQIKNADFEIIVRISGAIPLNDKKLNSAFCNKFGISSLVCLILQVEQIYVTQGESNLNVTHKDNWRNFLKQVATSLNRTIQIQTISAAIESDSIQPIMNHFSRFKDLKLDALLDLITEAKQQIN